MNVQSLNEFLESDIDVRLLDVRTTGEFESAHLPGAYNVPLDQLREHASELRRVQSPVVLICQSGGRARQAEAMLREAGMKDLHLLEGGMNAWLAAGQSIQRGGKTRISLERQVRILAGSLIALFSLLSLKFPLLAWVPALMGCGLVFAGITDTCGMALLLAKLPYNRGATCNPEAVVKALQSR